MWEPPRRAPASRGENTCEDDTENKDDGYALLFATSEADARAEMLIYLIENRLIPGTVNQTPRCRGMDMTTIVGSLAALGTTVSYFPQLMKCWKTGQSGDLSFKMFAILTGGIALWVVYGLLKSDYVISISNTVSLCFLAGVLYFKVRERSGRNKGHPQVRA